MPEEKLRPQESENLRADIKRLSEYSEQLRQEATKNARKADALVASLEAQYGEHVPVADSVQRLEKLSRETGAPIAFLF